MKLTSVLAVVLAAVCLAPAAMAGTSLHTGSSGPAATQLQQNLHANLHGDFYGGAIDGIDGPETTAGLARWQSTMGFRPSGTIAIGSTQWNLLRSQAVVTRLAGYISRTAINAARAEGWAVDASKSPGIVSVLHYDPATRLVVVTLSISAAYGGYKADDNTTHSTPDGFFRMCYKGNADTVANVPGKPWNGAPMKWAAFFDCQAGDAFHYDGLFPSHGCVHIPSMPAAKYINSLRLGTAVVVHQ